MPYFSPAINSIFEALNPDHDNNEYPAAHCGAA